CSSSGSPLPIRIMELQIMAQRCLPRILHLYLRQDLKFTPTARLKAELVCPITAFSNRTGKCRVKPPLDELYRIKGRIVSFDPTRPLPPVLAVVLFPLLNFEFFRHRRPSGSTLQCGRSVL